MSEREDEPLADLESRSPKDLDAEELRAALTSPERLARQRGARACARLAAEDPEAVRPYLSELTELLVDDSLVAAQQAANALIPVAKERPGLLEDTVENVLAFADTDLGGDRARAATILADVVVERPELCAPHVDDLVRLVATSESDLESHAGEASDDAIERETLQRHERKESRARAVGRVSLLNVVVAVAEEHPEAVVDEVGELVTLVETDTDGSVVAAALDALTAVGEHDPAAIADAVDPASSYLDHPDEALRARVIRMLGVAGDEGAVPALREVAEGDENEEIRSLAADTADFLAS